MADRVKGELKQYLQKKEEADSVRLERTIALCRELAGKQKEYQKEERTTFWQYLSDIFRIDGREILLLQVLLLAVCALGLSAAAGAPQLLSVFSPLFVLGALPVLFRGKAHNMTEMEAATRASGAQAVLAKLILAGAANLVCMTLLFAEELIRQREAGNAGRIVLYLFVPYLICLVMALRSLRKRNREGMQISLVFTVFSCFGWGASAKLCPFLYEAAAVGIWLILFVVFGVFFAKELAYILNTGKGGIRYGTVD